MAGVVKHMGTVFSRNLLKHLGEADEGPRPRRHRLRRLAPRARTCSSTATRWSPRRPRRPTPTASAGTSGSRRSAATSPTPPPSRGRSPDVDAVVYLVHSLDRSDFTDRDRLAAETVAAAVADSGVRRLVYLSGLVPDVPEARAVRPHRLPARGRADPARRRRRRASRCGPASSSGPGRRRSRSSARSRRSSSSSRCRLWMQHRGPADRRLRRAPRRSARRSTTTADAAPSTSADPTSSPTPDLMQRVRPRGAASPALRAPGAGRAPADSSGSATALATTAPFHTVTVADRVAAPRHGLPPRPHVGAARRRTRCSGSPRRSSLRATRRTPAPRARCPPTRPGPAPTACSTRCRSPRPPARRPGSPCTASAPSSPPEDTAYASRIPRPVLGDPAYGVRCGARGAARP